MLASAANEALRELAILFPEKRLARRVKAAEIIALFTFSIRLVLEMALGIIEVAVAEMPTVLGVSHAAKGVLKTPYPRSFKFHCITIFPKRFEKAARCFTRCKAISFPVLSADRQIGKILDRQNQPVGDDKRPHIFLLRKPGKHDSRVDTQQTYQELAHLDAS